MGVALYWKPIDPNAGNYFAGRSNLHKVLENAFGCYPIELCHEDIGRLEGIAACGNDEVHELIEAINKNDKGIKITAEW